MLWFKRLFIFLAFIYFRSAYAKADSQFYPDQGVFIKHAYGVLLNDILEEMWESKQKDSLLFSKYLNEFNVLAHYTDNNNDTTQLYKRYARLKIELFFTTGVNNKIPEYFRQFYSVFHHAQIKSVINVRAITAVVHYYKSIGKIEYLLELIDMVHVHRHLISEKDRIELLSTLYYETFQFEHAIELYREAYARTTHPLRRVSLLNNIGLAYMYLDQPKKAKEHFQTCLKQIELIRLDTAFVRQQIKEGKANYQPGLLNDFRKNIEENLKEVGDKTWTKEEKLDALLKHSAAFYLKYKRIDIDLYYDIAYTYSNLSAYETSNIYLDTLEDNFRRSVRYSDLELRIKKLRVFNNLKLGNINEALNNLTLEESSEDNPDGILAYRKFQQKKFNQEKEGIESDYQQNKTRVMGLFFIGLLALSYVSYKIWKKKRLQQKKAEYRQQQMVSVKKESELLLKEADHRIMNSIQLVANMASLEKMKGEKDFDIEGFQLKMMSIAEIHKLMYKNRTEHISTVDYLNEIITLLKVSLSFRGIIKLNVNEENHLMADDLKNIGLILIELIINTIKHTSVMQPDAVCIDINLTIKSSVNWNIYYTDNGVFNYKTFTSNSKYKTSMVAILIQALLADYQIKDLPHFNINIYKT